MRILQQANAWLRASQLSLSVSCLSTRNERSLRIDISRRGYRYAAAETEPSWSVTLYEDMSKRPHFACKSWCLRCDLRCRNFQPSDGLVNVMCALCRLLGAVARRVGFVVYFSLLVCKARNELSVLTVIFSATPLIKQLGLERCEPHVATHDLVPDCEQGR
jgi:hypothetical protein